MKLKLRDRMRAWVKAREAGLGAVLAVVVITGALCAAIVVLWGILALVEREMNAPRTMPAPCQAPTFRQVSTSEGIVIGLDEYGETWRWEDKTEPKCWVRISKGTP